MKTNRMKQRISDYIDVRNLKKANMMIPISRALRKKLKEWGIESIILPIPSGVDTNMFKPMSVERSSDFTVAYAGRLSPEKYFTPNENRRKTHLGDLPPRRKSSEISIFNCQIQKSAISQYPLNFC